MGEGAVADLASARSAEPLDLARGEGGEIVVEHEVAVRIAFEGFHLLLVVLCAQSRRHQGLGFTAREQRGAVGARQVADFRPDRADFLHAPAVHANALVYDQAPHLALLDLLEVLPRFRLRRRLVRHVIHAHEMSPYRLESGHHGLGTRLLLMNGEGLGHPGGGDLLNLGLEGRIGPGIGVEGPARLGRLAHEVLLDARQRLALLVAEGERFEHLVFADLPASGLDHEHRVLGACDDDLELRGGQLLVRRIRHQLALDQRHPHGAQRAPEGEAGQAERGGGADHGQHIRIILVVGRDHQVDDLNLIAETLRKERADRPVDEAAGERLLFVRPALALEETSGDLPARVSALSILHGERQEVAPFHGRLGRDHGGQHDGAAAAHDDGAVGLLGHLAGLDGDGAAVELGLYGMARHEISRPPLIQAWR